LAPAEVHVSRQHRIWAVIGRDFDHLCGLFAGILGFVWKEAVKSAIAEAAATVRHMDWFEVVEERGRITDGKVVEFQVTIKVGFKIERKIG
jgi:flavin-binding protein dodecin